MTVLEIIAAILLILACVFIVLVVLMQDSKQGMSQAITGASADNFYQKNSGRSKEARLAKMTRTAAIVVFVVALAVNIISTYAGGEQDAPETTTTAAVETTADESAAADESDAADGADTSENAEEPTDTTAE